MALSPRDYSLSMRVSRRTKNGQDDGLRSMLVHRLRDAAKLILRVSLKEDLTNASAKYSLHCEPCDRWHSLDAWAEEIVCPGCERVYAVEFAVFSEIKDTKE
jgi:hypothetical protein